MCPTTVLIIIVVAALSFVGLLLQIPTFVLGLLLSPLMRRMAWFVEFIYPAGIARTVHIALMQWGLNSKVGRGSGVKGKSGLLMPPQHSRSVEQRTEVVKGRIYVHPIPQLLDNVGYLIVCCPPPESGDGRKSSILGILVDCGDATSALAQVELIRDTHYSELQGKPQIAIHSVLCTHKHHDHTAGNRHLLANKNVAATLKSIVGGAVEQVPYCTHPVKNGDRVKLPKSGNNDMSELIEIECIAVPSHTRGSIVYAMRNLMLGSGVAGGFVSHIFSGDAMFSGGGGVPFESDIETPADKNINTKNRNSLVKVTAGRCSIERCFAEVLFRTTKQINGSGGRSNSGIGSVGSGHPRQVLMFPGHEYTSDLLLRQLDPSNEHHGHWTKLPPAIFFETASQYLISSHRRTLPKNGRLLTVPSSLDRELRTNPHFRALKKRGEHLITAVKVWHRYMSRIRKEEAQNAALNLVKESSSSVGNGKSFSSANTDTRKQGFIRTSSNGNTPSTESSWTLDANDINRSVFATVYSSDLDMMISDLQSGKVSGANAAKRLLDMRTKLEEPVVTRRPIPGTLPSEKNMYLAVVALALLGSPPCGMTVRDGLAMNIPVPLDSSDEIIISKQRIISMLALLGLLDGPSSRIASENKDNEDEPCIIEMIETLWKEAHSDSEAIDSSDLALSDEGKTNEVVDPEETVGDKKDGIELGLLKMTLNGAALNQPSWFKKYCLPCGSETGARPAVPLPPSVAKMRQSGGELVRHDIHSCPMCRDAVTGSAFTGDSVISPDFKEEEDGKGGNGASDNDDFERVEHKIHQSPLMEGCGDSSEDDDERSGVELKIVSSV
jgi:glyoxylase-like metal-dependent hydrolase (beta-lactamase superfamily II)